jgi:hypothetical protein
MLSSRSMLWKNTRQKIFQQDSRDDFFQGSRRKRSADYVVRSTTAQEWHFFMWTLSLTRPRMRIARSLASTSGRWRQNLRADRIVDGEERKSSGQARPQVTYQAFLEGVASRAVSDPHHKILTSSETAQGV